MDAIPTERKIDNFKELNCKELQGTETNSDERHVGKRLPRMMLTHAESDAILLEMQNSWTIEFADSPFLFESSSPFILQRIKPMLHENEESGSQKLSVNVVFVSTNHNLRRDMCFICPGHEGASCRLSMAANCLLEFPSLLSRILPKDSCITQTDINRFRLWSLDRWEDVYVEGTLPMLASACSSCVYLEIDSTGQPRRVLGPQLRFMSLAAPQRGELELWPYYLEKAVAKMLGSYLELRALTFENAISMLMGCEVFSSRISDDVTQQGIILLQILTVMQRNSIVFLRQESQCQMCTCSPACMLHQTEDVYIVLAFKQSTDSLEDFLTMKKQTQQQEQQKKPNKEQEQQQQQERSRSEYYTLMLHTVQLMVRRISCSPLSKTKRCQNPLRLEELAKAPKQGLGFAARANSGEAPESLLDMSRDQMFSDRGVFWETAAYLLGHFSHMDVGFFGQDVPPTAQEDLINLNLLPWVASRASSSWVRGKNSLTMGSRRQQSFYSPQFVLELWTSRPDQLVLVALTLRQAATEWRRTNKIPARMQIYLICDSEISRVARRELVELKSREKLERRLAVANQLTRRSVFTTGPISELLILRNGSYLIILEVGIPGEEGDFCLTAYASSNSRLMPFQNIIDTSFEYSGGHPDANIRCREFLTFIDD